MGVLGIVWVKSEQLIHIEKKYSQMKFNNDFYNIEYKITLTKTSNIEYLDIIILNVLYFRRYNEWEMYRG